MMKMMKMLLKIPKKISKNKQLKAAFSVMRNLLFMKSRKIDMKDTQKKNFFLFLGKVKNKQVFVVFLSLLQCFYCFMWFRMSKQYGMILVGLDSDKV